MKLINIKNVDNFPIYGGGVIVYSKYRNNIYLLLGRETCITPWPDMYMFSEFGGKLEKNERIIDGIIREFYEETQGIFGIQSELFNKIYNSNNKNCVYVPETNSLYLFFKIKYDLNIINSYNNTYKYYREMVEKNNMLINYYEQGYYEKDQIKYFKLKSLSNHKTKMRSHFVNITHFLVKNKEKLFV
jgi:hypothetical protein